VTVSADNAPHSERRCCLFAGQGLLLSSEGGLISRSGKSNVTGGLAIVTEDSKALLSRTSVVLIEPSEPLNIGSALRACWNMGVHDLRLVRPKNNDPARIAVTATGLDEQAANLPVFDTPREALADGLVAIGFSARARRSRHTVWSLEQLVDQIEDTVAKGAGRLHLVFGPEYAGLSNEVLELCQICCTVSTDPGHHSLNLAQAVLLGTHAVRRASLDLTRASWTGEREPSATLGDVDALMGDVSDALRFIEFFKFDGAERSMGAVLRSILLRADLDKREIGTLRGIFTEMVNFSRRQGVPNPDER